MWLVTMRGLCSIMCSALCINWIKEKIVYMEMTDVYEVVKVEICLY